MSAPTAGSRMAGRWLGPAGKIGFVVAALALAQVIGDQFQNPIEEVAEPRLHTVAVGEGAQLRALSIEVEDVRLGTALVEDDTTLPTEGVWVVTDVTYTPTTQDAGVPMAQIVDQAGRTYRQTRLGSSSCISTMPDVPLSCSVALEVPADALEGARLRLGANEDPRYDDLLDVDLGLSAADGEAAVAAAETVELRMPDLPLPPIPSLGGGDR